MDKLNQAITADKAVAAYDAYIFASVGRAFDGFKADMLAADAANACTTAARLTKKAARNGQPNLDRAAEFASIAGSLA